MYTLPTLNNTTHIHKHIIYGRSAALYMQIHFHLSMCKRCTCLAAHYTIHCSITCIERIFVRPLRQLCYCCCCSFTFMCRQISHEDNDRRVTRKVYNRNVFDFYKMYVEQGDTSDSINSSICRFPLASDGAFVDGARYSFSHALWRSVETGNFRSSVLFAAHSSWKVESKHSHPTNKLATHSFDESNIKMSHIRRIQCFPPKPVTA